MAWSPGERLGPYEIGSLIGRGGMGEVYRAHDSRLNRTVAVKRVTSPSMQRFRTEAHAVAALNHPHICQIYDVGPDYLVLEYVAGEPLKGPLGADEAVRLSLQIADALAAAHARGIIHRDLKPANVVVRTEAGASTVKLLDFGVSAFVAAGADATRTADGDVVGTPAYMSPEQAHGRPPDARSDIFSFGAVLYELLAGSRAFNGDSAAEVLSAVLRDDPAPLDAPASLSRIVTRCLAKDPSRRFQTMDELKQALQQVMRGGGDAQAAIAVLPFANLSADPENEYFGDGLAEEIINALAQVDGLKVIARTSAFSFKGKPQDVRQIARTLGVSHVLEGSVRRAGDRVRVTAQLIAAADGAHAWSERFDRPMADVFAMQDEMAGAITTALKGRLGVARAPARQYVPDIDAYESYLSGRTHLNQFTPEAWNRAKADLDRAMRADPAYAKPHAELALAYFIRGMHFMQPMREVAPFVRAEVRRALELDPTDPQPRFVLGAIALAHDYEWEEAAEHFAASMSGPHVPGHARWIYASLYLRGLGRFEESAAEMARAAEQDPLNATWQAIWAAHLIDARGVDEAMAIARRSIDIDPTYFLPHNMLGEASWAAGLRDEAVAAFERAHALAPWFGSRSAGWRRRID
jgi:eukaryotic-like serine/threonine-protein kinase